MNMRSVGLIVSLAVAALLPLSAQTRTVRLSGAPPPPVANIGAVVSGTPGLANACYWVVVNYTGGAIVSPKPACLQVVPNTLSMSNFVKVTWSAAAVSAPGTVTYDVLKTASPSNGPVPGQSTALATGLTVTTTNDTGGSLSAYTQAAFPFLNPSTLLTINNRDYNPPQIQFVNNPFLLALGNNQFPFPIDTSGAAETLVYAASAQPSLAQLNAGFTLVATNSLRTLKVQRVLLQAIGGDLTACTDVRISDTNLVDAITVAVAGLTSGVVVTEGAAMNVTLGTFSPTALSTGAGLQIRKTGSACTTSTSIRVIVLYTINS